VLVFIGELVRNFDVQEQGSGIEFGGGARLFVLARLLQISTVRRAIESDFALLSAALRTNAPVNGGAKASLFAQIADSAIQRVESPSNIMVPDSGIPERELA
jgi:hypothetical protein